MQKTSPNVTATLATYLAPTEASPDGSLAARVSAIQHTTQTLVKRGGTPALRTYLQTEFDYYDTLLSTQIRAQQVLAAMQVENPTTKSDERCKKLLAKETNLSNQILKVRSYSEAMIKALNATAFELNKMEGKTGFADWRPDYNQRYFHEAYDAFQKSKPPTPQTTQANASPDAPSTPRSRAPSINTKDDSPASSVESLGGETQPAAEETVATSATSEAPTPTEAPPGAEENVATSASVEVTQPTETPPAAEENTATSASAEVAQPTQSPQIEDTFDAVENVATGNSEVATTVAPPPTESKGARRHSVEHEPTEKKNPGGGTTIHRRSARIPKTNVI